MKPLQTLTILVSLALAGILAGCTSSQQQITYNSLATIEATADTGYSNYVTLVIKGSLPTNQLPTISKAYNDLHAAVALAATLDQASTNAIVGTNVTVELTSLLQLIATATQGH